MIIFNKKIDKYLTNELKRCKLYPYYRYSLFFWKKWIKLEEKIEISILLNLYGNLLTETQKNYMDLYYNQDYSLSEIGDNENITRQAVRTILVKSKNKLYEYEQKLRFMEKENNIKKLLEKIQASNNEAEKQKYLKKIQENLDY